MVAELKLQLKITKMYCEEITKLSILNPVKQR